jgi:perosamine synthetase
VPTRTDQDAEDLAMKPKIVVTEPSIGEEELKLVTEAVRSGWVSSKGKFIEEFENNFANYIGAKYGIAVSNGTVALHLALTALGLGLGDEVIVPTLTFASVANAVIYTGANPVLVDSHPDYWCINLEEIERKITRRTKAIIPVHLYGHPCDMGLLMKISRSYDLNIIEDCAEAHGAEYKGKKVGSFGDISCFSFYGNKVITTGEGGMCLTNNHELAEKMRTLRDHGMKPEKRYWHEVIGFNYRMTNLQAALGVAQLRKIEDFIKRKREIARLYSSLLRSVKGVTLHPEMPWAKNIYWLYSILVNRNAYRFSKNELMEKLAENGIETRSFFYPLHTMPPYKKYAKNCKFPVSEKLFLTGINLPSSVKITEKEIRQITFAMTT